MSDTTVTRGRLPSRHPGFIAVYVIPETGETYELRDADMARLPWCSTFQHADGRVTRTLRRSLEVAS